MGITGLLPFLKDASTSVNIKQFQGQTVAVDTYCWIYRGAFSCAEELAMGKKADGHIKYVLKYVQRFLEWGIKPIMVFDGSCLPSKKGTEMKRRESKEAYRKKAAQFLKEGKRTEARECFQRCIDCTPQMALDVIQALHAIGVDVCVAPYEADAQLAFLSKSNIAQLIITEDSDLMLFGCEKVIYKLDINGNGTLVEKEKIISITQFDSADNFERFRWMCILSGCDYLESLPGIGLGKAKKLLKTVQKSDIDHILKQMPKILKMPNLNITNEYIENFKKADKTFKYQIVFDPRQRKLVSLHSYESQDETEDLTYAGYFYDDEEALQHSLGNIEVHKRTVHYNFDPDNWRYRPPVKFLNDPPPHMKSIWSKNYQTYNKSNPLNTRTRTDFFNTTSKTETIHRDRPITLGMSKKVKSPFRSPINNNKKKTSEEKKAKRKFDSLNFMDDELTNLKLENSADDSSSVSASDSGFIAGSNESVGKRLKVDGIVDDFLVGYTNEAYGITDMASKKDQDNLELLQHLSPIKELLMDKDVTENIDEIKREFLHLTESNLQSPIITKKIDLDSFKSKGTNKFKINRYPENSPIINEKSINSNNKRNTPFCKKQLEQESRNLVPIKLNMPDLIVTESVRFPRSNNVLVDIENNNVEDKPKASNKKKTLITSFFPLKCKLNNSK